jgi:hypothetical protein
MQMPEELQVSSPLHQVPSLQAKPEGRLVQAVWLMATLQSWHGFIGLAAPFA